MNALRHMIRGCGTLPHVGPHHGTLMLLVMVTLGAAAGAQRDWRLVLAGAGVMLAVMGPFYLWGAYDRSRLSARLTVDRSDRLRDICDGWDDPDDRCPRDPDKCLCVPARQAVAALNGKGPS